MLFMGKTINLLSNQNVQKKLIHLRRNYYLLHCNLQASEIFICEISIRNFYILYLMILPDEYL